MKRLFLIFFTMITLIGFSSAVACTGTPSNSNCNQWDGNYLGCANYFNGYDYHGGQCSNVYNSCSGDAYCAAIYAASDCPVSEGICARTATYACLGTVDCSVYIDPGECDSVGAGGGSTCQWSGGNCINSWATCGDFDDVSCSSVNGCYFQSGDCSGDPGCEAYTNQGDCESQACTWTEATCTYGLGCSGAGSQESCRNHGCTENYICSGTMTCAAQTITNGCNSLSGCLWDSCYQPNPLANWFINKTCVFVNNRTNIFPYNFSTGSNSTIDLKNTTINANKFDPFEKSRSVIMDYISKIIFRSYR